MGRRSDHNRDELRELLISAGQGQMARSGFAGFSARAVASAAGYSVGTISNVFGNVDGLITAINTRTIHLWTDEVVHALAKCGRDTDRLAILVRAYFKFAACNTNLWTAVYDHRRSKTSELDEALISARGRLVGIIEAEVATFLGARADQELRRLTHSLIAVVHGHCDLFLSGSYLALGDADPSEQPLARVKEILSVRERTNQSA